MAGTQLVLDGRFRVIRHLGGGGMSEVYLAEQVSLGRQVALKVLKRDLGAQPAMVERFKREARILSSVDHPSVVRVIDFASAPDGMVLVLELAEGETLEHVLKFSALEPARAVRLLLQLAEGLAAIHEKGIVHRDIKPQNVVVGQGPRGEQARLLDFGIARLMEIPETAEGAPEMGHANPFVSVPGQAVGTPAYVAPEQATAQPVDSRTDVYSFGVLAFRCLAGRLPFLGPDVQSFLQQHVHEKPPHLDTLATGLEAYPGLSALVMKCLEKDPKDRPPNGQAIARELERYHGSDVALSVQNRRALSNLTTQTWNAVQSTTALFGKTSILHVRRAAVAATGLTSQWKRSLLITLFAIVAIPVAFALMPLTTAQEAERLLRAGQNEEGLALLESEIPHAGSQLPALLSLRAAALHRLGRHPAERSQIVSSPYQTLHPANPLLLEALAEDFGNAENDPQLKEFLSLVPPESLNPALKDFAVGSVSGREWGALRWLDLNGETKGLNLVSLYSKALGATLCTVRSTAATRLAALGDDRAIQALRELSESPKEESPTGPISCGQDEAAEAIRQLKKKAH